MTQRTTYLFLLSGIFIVIALWLPFGFQLNGIVEEWGVLGLLTKQPSFFFVTPDSAMAKHYLRPLTILPHAIAHFLSPDSFNAWHIIQMLILFIKAVSASFLAWMLTRSREWSLFFGLLLIIYPADTMQLPFRGIHINLSLSLALAAAAMNFSVYSISSKKYSNILTLSSSLLFLVSILLYETAIAFTPLTALLLFIRSGFKEGWKQICQQPIPLLGWLLAPALYLLYVLVALVFWPVTGHRHANVVKTIHGTNAFLKNHFPKLFSIGLMRALMGGWFDALRIVLTEYKNYFYLISVTLICSMLVFFSSSSKTKEIEKKVERPVTGLFLVRLIVSGLLLFMLSYSTYLPSMSHLSTSQRTFLFASLGAALVVLAVLIGVSKINRWVAIFFGSGLLFFGIGAQLYQFHHYQKISDAQRQILRTLMENFDGDLKGKKLLILDGSNQLNHTWMLQYNLLPALRYLYGKDIPSLELCLTPEGSWFKKDKRGRDGVCIEERDQWTFKPQSSEKISLPSSTPKVFSIKKNDLTILTIDPDGSIKEDPALNAYRSKLKNGHDIAARRYQNILKTKTWPLAFNQFNSSDSNKERFTWHFGKWWGMGIPTRGTGWQEERWEINKFYHRSFRWKNQKHSSLLFDLSPAQKPYILEGQFHVRLNQPFKDNMDIRLNKHKIAYRWLDDHKFEARIPKKALTTGINRIEINSGDAANYSAQLDWLTVRPESLH